MRRWSLAVSLGFLLACEPGGAPIPSSPAATTPAIVETALPVAAPAASPTESPALATGRAPAEAPDPEAASVEQAGGQPARPNVLLITVDSVRADHVGTYGGPARTPTLDWLASQGVRFTNVYAQLPQTTPSHAAILTGQYASTSGVRIAHHDALPDGKPTLARAMQDAGYQTGGIYSWAGPVDGFDQGFQNYVNVATADADGRADLTTGAAIAWLTKAAAERDKPFFLWVHYRDPHYPYEPPAPFDTLYAPRCDGCVDGSLATLNRLHGGWRPTPAELARILAAYDGEISYSDHEVGRLLTQLAALGLEPTTLVVVTSDHGDAFGEHGEWFHGLGVYQETIHVPLVARLPGALPAGVAFDGVVQLIDVMPTVLDVVGLPPAPSAEGRSLVSALRSGGTTDGPAITEVSDGHYTAVVLGEWKLIRDNLSGQRALYHLPSDPGEQRNRAASDPGPAARLTAVLDQWDATRAAGTLWRAP